MGKSIIVTIHQPEHLPWLGFFHKISQTDLFVILDNVQFRKNYFQNRNKVRTSKGWSWITVPVSHKANTLIKEVLIAPENRWKKKWWDTIYFSYKKAKYFDDYSGQLYSIINNDWKYLSHLNIRLIELLCNYIGIEIRYVNASDMDLKGKGSDLILEMCQKLNAETYLSGVSGRDYLEKNKFEKENVKVVYQEFYHPIYKQLYEPFEPCMSVIDLLFNYGPRSLDIINGKGVPAMDKLFL